MSEATQTDGKVISENAVRAASAELYSDILSEHAGTGGGILGSQIENGFKRHFEELKLQLIDSSVCPGEQWLMPAVKRGTRGASMCGRFRRMMPWPELVRLYRDVGKGSATSDGQHRADPSGAVRLGGRAENGTRSWFKSDNG